MIAALFVQTNGAYFGLDDVDPWDEARDARKYAGPYPVVAHPPCSRWCRLAGLVEARWGHKRGEDGGCFASALASVRKWGGGAGASCFQRCVRGARVGATIARWLAAHDLWWLGRERRPGKLWARSKKGHMALCMHVGQSASAKLEDNPGQRKRRADLLVWQQNKAGFASAPSCSRSIGYPRSVQTSAAIDREGR